MTLKSTPTATAVLLLGERARGTQAGAPGAEISPGRKHEAIQEPERKEHASHAALSRHGPMQASKSARECRNLGERKREMRPPNV